MFGHAAQPIESCTSFVVQTSSTSSPLLTRPNKLLGERLPIDPSVLQSHASQPLSPSRLLSGHRSISQTVITDEHLSPLQALMRNHDHPTNRPPTPIDADSGLPRYLSPQRSRRITRFASPVDDHPQSLNPDVTIMSSPEASPRRRTVKASHSAAPDTSATFSLSSKAFGSAGPQSFPQAHSPEPPGMLRMSFNQLGAMNDSAASTASESPAASRRSRSHITLERVNVTQGPGSSVPNSRAASPRVQLSKPDVRDSLSAFMAQHGQ